MDRHEISPWAERSLLGRVSVGGASLGLAKSIREDGVLLPSDVGGPPAGVTGP